MNRVLCIKLLPVPNNDIPARTMGSLQHISLRKPIKGNLFRVFPDTKIHYQILCSNGMLHIFSDLVLIGIAAKVILLGKTFRARICSFIVFGDSRFAFLPIRRQNRILLYCRSLSMVHLPKSRINTCVKRMRNLSIMATPSVSKAVLQSLITMCCLRK